MSIYMKLQYKTKFTDKEILKKAIKKAKYTYVERQNELICTIACYELHLIKDKNEEYKIVTHGYNDFKYQIKEFRDTVTPIYEKLLIQAEKLTQAKLQKQICDNIKTKVTKSMTMKLVQEERYDDNSIVLTINL